MESLSLITIHAKEFKTKVTKAIENIEEQNTLYQSLRTYQETKSIQQLVSDLKEIIGSQTRQHLFSDIRSFLFHQHLATYDQLIPEIPKGTIYVIKMRKTGNDGFGFTIRGGLEHGVGIFVSSVRRGSRASIGGLRTGDEILRINGLILKDSTHEEVVNLLKGRKHLILQVKREGKLPSKINDNIHWEAVVEEESPYYSKELLTFILEDTSATSDALIELQENDRKVEIIKGAKSLGCSIRNTTTGVPGIFIVSVRPNSVSDQAGLKVGDKILAVNGRSFTNVKYSEAVYIMKSSKKLSMIVRHNEEVQQFIQQELIEEIPEEAPKPSAPSPVDVPSAKEKLPAFAVKTELLVRMSERENRQKEKEQIQKSQPERRNGQQSGPSIPAPINTEAIYTQDLSHKKANFTESVNVISQESEAEPTSPLSPRSLPSPIFPNPSNCEYSDEVLEGRKVSLLTIEKVSDLGMTLEEKLGKIVIKEIKDGGCIKEHGVMNVGDQLLNVEGTSLINVSLAEAEQELTEAMKRRSTSIDLVVAFCGERNAKFTFTDNVLNSEKVISSVTEKCEPTEEEGECYDTWL